MCLATSVSNARSDRFAAYSRTSNMSSDAILRIYLHGREKGTEDLRWLFPKPQKEAGWTTLIQAGSLDQPYSEHKKGAQKTARLNCGQLALARLVFVDNHVTAPSLAPNSKQGVFVLGILGQLDRLLGVSDRLAVD